MIEATTLPPAFANVPTRRREGMAASGCTFGLHDHSNPSNSRRTGLGLNIAFL